MIVKDQVNDTGHNKMKKKEYLIKKCIRNNNWMYMKNYLSASI